MEINKKNDEDLKNIYTEIIATGDAKKKIKNEKKLSFQEKLLKSVISPNHKEVIQRIMGVDNINSKQIEANNTETNADEIDKRKNQIIQDALGRKYYIDEEDIKNTKKQTQRNL